MSLLLLPNLLPPYLAEFFSTISGPPMWFGRRGDEEVFNDHMVRRRGDGKKFELQKDTTNIILVSI